MVAGVCDGACPPGRQDDPRHFRPARGPQRWRKDGAEMRRDGASRDAPMAEITSGQPVMRSGRPSDAQRLNGHKSIIKLV